MALVLAGITLIAVGVALIVLDVYRSTPDEWWLPFISTISLRFMPRLLRVVIFGGIGAGVLIAGIWGLNRALMAPFVQPGKAVVETLSLYRRKERGPKIVAIGGGTGLSTLLRGLKDYTSNLNAVVTVADDGGSSGRLRRSLGILPPGDIRNCLAALSNDEDMISQLFRYRFADTGTDGLDGHSFGNLFLTALTEINGSFEDAIAASGRVLSVGGRVYPSTLDDVHLAADVELPFAHGEIRVKGESRIPEVDGSVQRVWLEPNDPPAFPKAIQALLSADLIIAGPGSLYTSILPNLLVPDIAAAFRASRALKIFVCNVATQPGETQGYTCADHLQAIDDHLGPDLFEMVVVNDRWDQSLPDNLSWVDLEPQPNVPLYASDMVDEELPWRHDSAKLGRVLIDLLQERTGPLML
jgi:uncharacterized cofD-like protein